MDLFKIATDLIQAQVLGVALGGVATIASTILYNCMKDNIKAEAKKLVRDINRDASTKILSIQYPLLRGLAMNAFLYVEKKFVGKSGEEKFNIAKKYVLDRCPDVFDSSVDLFLQSCYNELKAEIQADQMAEAVGER